MQSHLLKTRLAFDRRSELRLRLQKERRQSWDHVTRVQDRHHSHFHGIFRDLNWSALHTQTSYFTANVHREKNRKPKLGQQINTRSITERLSSNGHAITANTRLRPHFIALRSHFLPPASLHFDEFRTPSLHILPSLSLPDSCFFGARASHRTLSVNETTPCEGLAITLSLSMVIEAYISPLEVRIWRERENLGWWRSGIGNARGAGGRYLVSVEVECMRFWNQSFFYGRGPFVCCVACWCNRFSFCRRVEREIDDHDRFGIANCFAAMRYGADLVCSSSPPQIGDPPFVCLQLRSTVACVLRGGRRSLGIWPNDLSWWY